MRWPERSPDLALNPRFGFFLLLFSWFFLLGGFKGQVRWPKGRPHLALNPPFVFVCLVFFCFCFLFVFRRRTCFPPRKGILVFFQRVPLFLPSFFPLPFHSLFSLSLSIYIYIYIYLSLSLSLALVIFFLPSLFSLFLAFFSFLVFVSLFLCLVSLPLFHETSNIQILN